MTDIVDRLKDAEITVAANARDDMDVAVHDAIKDAQAEIERLRAALEQAEEIAAAREFDCRQAQDEIERLRTSAACLEARLEEARRDADCCRRVMVLMARDAAKERRP